EIKERAAVIREEIKNEQDLNRKERLTKRLSKISQSVAVIKAGGFSKPEVDDKIERIKDAVYAVKAAITDGIVAGGGITLYEIAEDIHDRVIDVPVE
ncbi:hypothetical protein LRR18_17970, partial [Mangrovimonas sp. AS39]